MDLGNLPGGKSSCLIRVAATDGINQRTDQSDRAFTKLGQPPMVTIISPDAAASFTLGEQVLFEGAASDLEDNTFSTDHMTWTSDVDGLLGTGLVLGTSGLSRGLHVVEFGVRDADGMSSSDTVAVYVGEPSIFPDVKMNGSDGFVYVTPTDSLSLQLGMNAGTGTGLHVDWWIGMFYFDMSGSTWVPVFFTDFQAPLNDFAPVDALRWPGAPVGIYLFLFGVDTNMNHIFNPAEAFLDYVAVIVTDPS